MALYCGHDRCYVSLSDRGTCLFNENVARDLITAEIGRSKSEHVLVIWGGGFVVRLVDFSVVL
jgi:hypothetical protein